MKAKITRVHPPVWQCTNEYHLNDETMALKIKFASGCTCIRYFLFFYYHVIFFLSELHVYINDE